MKSACIIKHSGVAWSRSSIDAIRAGFSLTHLFIQFNFLCVNSILSIRCCPVSRKMAASSSHSWPAEKGASFYLTVQKSWHDSQRSKLSCQSLRPEAYEALIGQVWVTWSRVTMTQTKWPHGRGRGCSEENWVVVTSRSVKDDDGLVGLEKQSRWSVNGGFCKEWLTSFLQILNWLILGWGWELFLKIGWLFWHLPPKKYISQDIKTQPPN